jgi:hypothetical protein
MCKTSVTVSLQFGFRLFSIFSYKYIKVIAQIIIGTCPLANKHRIAGVQGFDLALLGDACAYNVICSEVQALRIGGA